MYKSEFHKLCFGFLFIMFDFRIQGIDILPNIIGYILFAMALSSLSSCSEYFNTAGIFTAIMIFLSIFTIYQRPDSTGSSNYINGPFGFLSVIIAILSIIISLLVVYNLFKGIEDMAFRNNKVYLSEEAENKWYMYITLQIAILILFVLAFIGFMSLFLFIIMFIASIAVMLIMMNFMRRCGEQL